MRLSKSSGQFYYEIEGILQRGTYDTLEIQGWHFTNIAGYRWSDYPMSPNFQVKLAVYSGEKDSTDNKINLFIPIAARPPVNQLLPVGPTNIILLAPKGAIEITKGVDFSLTYYFIWRLRNTDGLYSRDMESLVRPADRPNESLGKYVAGGPTATMDFTFSKHFDLSLQFGYFFAGEYIKNTGNGKNVQAAALKAYYKF
jgi:hypothetical protein